MKLENIIIAATMVTALFSTMLIYYADANDKYEVNNYYNANLTSYETMLLKVENRSEEINTALQNLASENLPDLLGGLRQGVISALLIFKDSFLGIGLMFSQSISLFNLGSIGAVWIAVATIGTLMVFLVAFVMRKG